MMSSRKHIVIDTDCGNDDILAIGTLYLSPLYHIHMITNVHGMQEVDIAYDTFIKLFADEDDDLRPVVIPGHDYSNLPERSIMNETWGSDYKKDFNEVMSTLDLPTSTDHYQQRDIEVQIEKMADNLESLAMKYGPLIYLCLGPLTNIAHLLQKFPEIMKNCISKFVIMGGAVLVAGNTDDGESETNFHLDPIAAKYVFDHSSIPIELFGLEVANVPNGERLNICFQSNLDSSIKKRIAKMVEVHPQAKSYDTVVSYYLTHEDEFEFEEIKISINENTGKCIGCNNNKGIKLATCLKGGNSELFWSF